MRIRRSSRTYSYSSSSSAAAAAAGGASSYATVPANSFVSSSSNCASSSSSSSSSYSIDCWTRCVGLDILADAVQFVVGSALPMGVPVTRRRVVIRRKSAFKINKIDVSENGEQEEFQVEEELGTITKPEREKRVMALPSKYQDSVLQPWKRQNRQVCRQLVGDQ